MERCPNCRARWDGSTSCRRCGMDLDLLIAAERAAEHLVARGIAHLAVADPAHARRELTLALALHRTDFAELLLDFADWREAGAGEPMTPPPLDLDEPVAPLPEEPSPGLPYDYVPSAEFDR